MSFGNFDHFSEYTITILWQWLSWLICTCTTIYLSRQRGLVTHSVKAEVIAVTNELPIRMLRYGMKIWKFKRKIQIALTPIRSWSTKATFIIKFHSRKFKFSKIENFPTFIVWNFTRKATIFFRYFSFRIYELIGGGVCAQIIICFSNIGIYMKKGWK